LRKLDLQGQSSNNSVPVAPFIHTVAFIIRNYISTPTPTTMSDSTGNATTLTGFLILFHAAYSCLHFKSLLQDLDISVEDGFRTVPPLDVQLECLLGMLLVFVGQLLGPGRGTWQPCLTTARRPLAAPAYKTRDFDIYADKSRIVAALQTQTKGD
jgi:Membrane magnesium transporter